MNVYGVSETETFSDSRGTLRDEHMIVAESHSEAVRLYEQCVSQELPPRPVTFSTRDLGPALLSTNLHDVRDNHPPDEQVSEPHLEVPNDLRRGAA